MSTRGDRKTFRNEDLLLRVSGNVDPKIWDDSLYEGFLDELCGNREYQKEAIRTALRFLVGGSYANLRELAKENYEENEELQQRYGGWEGMDRHLQFPDQLACSIDQATGTGKSYVLYGLALILLAHGAVDRVLILCPSNTIEAGLLEKFRELASDGNLRDSLPSVAKVTAPKIINASETIVEGAICVENYHAILESVKSSIRDSLKGLGARVAVLNDEAHHVANASGGEAKKWKSFILNPEYGFRFVVGVSGTCYVGDEYFADVVHRYSLREAIEDRFVKRVEYVAEMPEAKGDGERWQLIYKRHAETSKKLKGRNIRPLTIIITRDIRGCEQVAEELRAFLMEWEEITLKEADAKILAVTSSSRHQANIPRLKMVDSPNSPVEYIVSVAMLSEGWDVKNVFQIVPHEEKAFNSKLLIAQVLGRGLRRPDDWKGEDPMVTVFNHDAWSGRIKHLVNEILEIERRLTSRVDAKAKWNFELHNLDYSREEDVSEYAKKGEYRLLEQGFVELPAQVESEDFTVEFERAVSGEHRTWKTEIQHKTWGAEEVAAQMYQRLRSIDEESKLEDKKNQTSYTKKYTLERCEEIVRASLKRAGIRSGRVTDENRQKFLQALGTLRRRSAKRVIYRMSPNALTTITTAERQAESCSAAELRRGNKRVFYPPGCETTLEDEQREFFRELQDPDGEFASGREVIDNASDFRTPANLVITDAAPERKFTRELCKREYSSKIDGWLKNAPMGFYSIQYAWKKGEHPKRGEFSPDFFIKQGAHIFVVEIKDDTEIADPSPENIKKHEYARAHFERLNQWLEREKVGARYQFNMISPKDYGKFFTKLRMEDLTGFRSDLDVALVNASKPNG